MSVSEKYVWMQREGMQGLPEPVVPAGYRIRAYRPGDGVVWTAITRETEKVYPVEDGSFEKEFPGEDLIRAGRVFFAEDSTGRPVGTVGAWYGKEGPDGAWGSIHWLAVLPGHEGKGLGRALLAHALGVLARHHRGTLLTCGTSRPAAVKIYLEAGFVPGIENTYDRDAWQELAVSVKHPTLEAALKDGWWKPKVEAPAPTEVVDALRAAAIPLVTCEAGHGFTDMQPIRALVGDARIVSLGEATHGTREFFQLKHRMLEFLVEELGFTAFAIEASFSDCLMLDRYVTTGEGDPLDGITNMRFWTWNTEEVLALVRWIRRHNETAKRPVRFYGFDMQSPCMAVQAVVRSLEQGDPAYAAELGRRVRPLADEFGSDAYGRLSAARQLEVAKALAEARDRIDRMTLPDPREQALARLHAKVAVQGEKLIRNGYGGGIRDRSMAENIGSLLDLEGPEGRIVDWAHNLHVTKSGGEGMGSHLHRRFGSRQVVFGFAFGEGSFQAMASTGTPGLRDFEAPAPPAGSLDETLARTGGAIMALDLRTAVPGTPAEAWLAAPHVTRSTGAVFSDDPKECAWFAKPTRIVECYDALLFVGHTNAARPNPDWQRLPPMDPPAVAQDAIEDYPAAMAGGLPRFWKPVIPRRRWQYETMVEEGAVRLRREGVPWEWGYGILQQSISATAYRGKRIRLSAEGRVAVRGAWDGAYLAVGADKGRPGWMLSAFPEGAMAVNLDNPWKGGTWDSRSLEISVPMDADYIMFAFALSGNGSGWIRKIHLEAA